MPLRNQFNSEAEWLEHLRMYFAAKAMQGDFAAGPDVSFDAFFKRAPSYYRMADAMLAAREGKP